MAKRDKILDKMKNNPEGWRIEDVEKLAKLYNLEIRKPSGSHVVLFHADHPDNLSIPARKPVKKVYIKKLVSFLEKVNK